MGRLVLTGRPHAWRRLSVTGWTFLMMGFTLGATTLACSALVLRGAGLNDPVWTFVAEPVETTLALADVGCLLTMAVTPIAFGVVYLGDSWRLQRFRVVLDRHGIASDTRPGLIPWDRVRHVAVTAGPPGLRRLLVDDGAAPAWWWWSGRPVTPGKAMVRQLIGRQPILVNVPIDLLTEDAGRILQAIRWYSGGRFPDPPRRRPSG